ncbi:MAG: hypothetical protein KF694_01865 [Mesorhizobium sp.]|nr:hypothetical protein [Mesorhizobium sp.]
MNAIHSDEAAWISDVVPTERLAEIVTRFEIPAEEVFTLCAKIHLARRFELPSEQDRKEVDRLRARREVFRSALREFRALPGTQFMPRGNAYSYYPQPPNPDGEPLAATPGTISASTFEAMLTALIEHDDHSIRHYEARVADRKDLGNRAPLRRYIFWLALMSFWYHDLGRPLTMTDDPIRGEVRGPIIAFISAMSENASFITQAERTPTAIGSFIKRSRDRAERDPHFGPERFLTV